MGHSMLDKTSASPHGEVNAPFGTGNNSEIRGPIIFPRHYTLSSVTIVNTRSRTYAPVPNFVRSASHSTIEDVIEVLPDTNYELLQPIPVQLKLGEDGGWIARFEAANIGMAGNNPEEAKELLSYYLIDAMESFLEEEKSLIPKLKRDLDALRRYIKFIDNENN